MQNYRGKCSMACMLLYVSGIISRLLELAETNATPVSTTGIYPYIELMTLTIEGNIVWIRAPTLYHIRYFKMCMSFIQTAI